MGMSSSQWESEDGDMWNSTASQESNSSCSSWGNAPKKGPPKVSEGEGDQSVRVHLQKLLQFSKSSFRASSEKQ